MTLSHLPGSRLYALPSYYMQVMFREAAGTSLLNSVLGSNATVTMATASMQGANTVIIKTAAYTNATTTLAVSLTGFGGGESSGGVVGGVRMFHKVAEVITLTSAAGMNATNSIVAPTAVKPSTSTVAVTGDGKLTVNVPAWSIIVVKLTIV